MNNVITVLIVDDSAFSRNMMKNLLKEVAGRYGIRLVTVEGKNGAEAVELYNLYKPGLVFMDIVMPEKTGLEALKEIKEQNRDAKVIMCSSMGQSAYINQAINLGCLDFIIKPYNDKLGIFAEIFKNYS